MSTPIPIETVFRTGDPLYARQDKNYPNRYHFRLPDNWTNDINKDAIMGIRSLFTTKSNRLVSFDIRTVYSIYSDTNQLVKSYSNTDITFYKFLDDSTQFKNLSDAFFTECQQLKFKPSNLGLTAPFEYLTNITPLDLHYKYENHKCNLYFTPNFNNVPIELRTFQQDNHTRHLLFEYKIYNLNEDAKALFNTDQDNLNTELTTTETKTENIWDRNSIIVYSNIVSDSDNQYIGHTRKYNNSVIKYYQVKGYSNEFHIDLFSTGDHQCPVELPKDGKDEIFIEAQLLRNAEQLN